VRSFFFSILGYFLTPFGIVLMGVLDASMVFFLPLGIDFVIILMTARHPDLFWLYALLATAGSIIGAAGTFWIGGKAGEKGLSRFVSPRRLRKVEARVNRGVVVVAALGLIPPPFPFTPFVLASGALRMNAWSFLGSLALVRLLRFGVEAALAHRYGSQILRWMRTPTFKIVVGVFIALAVIGTIVSAIALYRSSRSSRGGVRSGTEGSPRPPRMAPAARHPR
jgi:membrane protein YqaA with SNARE-associated domain